ncbi:uncharacterized protein N0V89_003731 [Didymosphaeria variabile]|uniref:NmrA-like domain-containing protein n=1 Tax=Didymosphaeria variabile TaxID=1932322 RepID=A0A9W8XPV3_9PLEO|nr:uncharacterized protein N0V89_003731 [Didymosphaeria variabile]KAJ4355711.1 hypothetical protein N0V89_003731 [Didymosphaeria variabile]
MPSKLITVFGATGLQGSSVLASLAANSQKPFTLRGTTRNPSSAAAKKLSDSGIQVVKADGWDKQSLISAFHGSWAVFANTNSDDAVFENPDEKRTEVDLGKIIVDAAAEAGVEVIVYSGFNSANKITGGKIPVAAFDDKNEIWEYAKSIGKFKTVVAAGPGWYFENYLGQDLAPILGGFPFVPAEDGTLVFRAPKWGGKEDVPFISIGDDYGDIVHAVSDIKSFGQMTQAFENATGKKARFEEIPNWRDLEVYGIRGLETIKNMWGFCQESGGRYFGDETEAKTAAELKKLAAATRGATGKAAQLATLEDFWKANFGTE